MADGETRCTYLSDGSDWLFKYREQLASLEPPVVVQEVEDRTRIAEACVAAEVLIADPALLSDSALAGAASLRGLQFITTEYHHLDLRALEDRGIVLAGVNDSVAPATASHVLDLAVSMARLTGHPGVSGVAQFPELAGKVVGIVGFGASGMELAHQLERAHCEVRYMDVRTASRRDFGDLRIRRQTLDRLLVESDFVFVLVPLTRQTRGLFDMREFRIMKPEAILINGSAPKVIVAADLLSALDDGLLAGAAITYRDEELESHERVLALRYPDEPSGDVAERVIGAIAENMRALISGERPAMPVESIDFPIAGDPSFWSTRFAARVAQ